MNSRTAPTLTDAEWTVMNAVWEQSPASVRDVLERVQKETSWAYTTVKTVMERLVEKGFLSTQKRANVGMFQPLVSRSQARKGAVRQLLGKAFDGAFGSLFQFLLTEERLSKRDREELLRIIREDRAEREEAKS